MSLFLPFLTYCTALMPGITNLKKKKTDKNKGLWLSACFFPQIHVGSSMSYTFAQFFIENIPLITKYWRRERLTKKMGVFFLAVSRKISLPRTKPPQNLGAREKKPRFLGFSFWAPCIVSARPLLPLGHCVQMEIGSVFRNVGRLFSGELPQTPPPFPYG